MSYTIDFCVISLAFLMITVIFYLRRVKVPSRRNTLFASLLICGVVSLVFDILAAYIDPFAYLLPSWLVYAINIIFLDSVQLSGPLFLLYILALTESLSRVGVAM